MANIIDYDFNQLDSQPVEFWEGGYHLVTITDAKVYENQAKWKSDVILEISNQLGQTSTQWFNFKHADLRSTDPTISQKRTKTIQRQMKQLKEIQDIVQVKDYQNASHLVGKILTIKVTPKKDNPAQFWINEIMPADQFRLLSQTNITSSYPPAPAQNSPRGGEHVPGSPKGYYKQDADDFQLTAPNPNDPEWQGAEQQEQHRNNAPAPYVEEDTPF